ncbi:hypothetical protein JCM9279_005879 [Rhodotorula babjevae]
MKPLNKPYQTVMDMLPPHLLMAMITACCGSGMLLFGYDQGVLGGLLTGRPFQRRFPSLTNNSTLRGFTVAVYELGCAAGAVFAFFCGDRLGRRQCIMLGMLVLSIGAILQFMSYSLAQLIVGRIVTGLGNGLNTATIPVYQNETSKAHHRGRAVVIEMATNIFGLMLAYWADYGLRNDQSDAQWRLPLALQVAFALITVTLIVFLPESPRWLVAHGDIPAARDVLFRLDGTRDAKARTASVDAQLGEIVAAVELERREAAGWGTCFTMGEQRFFHRVVLGCGSQFLQQISGINLISYYAPVIFETSVGMSHDTALLLSGLNGVAYFLSALVPIPLIERVGRRKLMIFSAAGQAVTMAVLAAMTEDTGNKAKGLVAAVCLFAFNFFFSCGFLSIPWLYPAEINPLSVRAQGAALATITNWLFTFLVVMVTPVAISTIGWKYYLVWTFTNFSFVFIIYFFYVETTGATLEDLDQLFLREKSWLIGPNSARLAEQVRRERAARRAEELGSGGGDMDKAGSKGFGVEHVERASDEALEKEE